MTVYRPALASLWLSIILLTSSCAPNTVRVSGGEEIESETVQLQESQLLDVGVLLFEEGEITKQQEQESIHEDIRAAEARYMAYHLKETLQRASGWGAIRVLPAASHIADVVVRSTIITSNGERLLLEVHVSDSTGSLWFEKKYTAELAELDYFEIDPGDDVYQHVYNRVANDIYRHRKKLTDRQLIRIRNTSELRYAASISPDPFSDYLVWEQGGQVNVARLPAREDPMLLRVRKVREREFLFIDTINEYYANFHSVMYRPYTNWRKYYLLEVQQKRAIERRATRTKLAAAAITLVGLLRDYPGLVTTGAMLYKDGIDIAKEARIHDDAIRELGDSLKAEVRPMVLDIQGRTVEITGTIEEQYRKWRALLREIYLNEAGLAQDKTAPDST